MSAERSYSVVVAPYALTQIEVALDWWTLHRPGASSLLARELETALRLMEYVPEAGRRAESKLFRNVRRLLLARSRYYLYYQVDEAARELRVLHFRHASRRPL